MANVCRSTEQFNTGKVDVRRRAREENHTVGYGKSSNACMVCFTYAMEDFCDNLTRCNTRSPEVLSCNAAAELHGAWANFTETPILNIWRWFGEDSDDFGTAKGHR
ncbi:hypothetical protein ACMFMG_003231 [Clarireedia jacksonii]